MQTPPVAVPCSDNACLRTAMLALLVAFVVVSAIALPKLQAKTDVPLAAVFPPWWSHEATLMAAAQTGVAILGQGAAANILIVRAADAQALGQLYKRGAWSVLSTGAAPDCETQATELRT